MSTVGLARPPSPARASGRRGAHQSPRCALPPFPQPSTADSDGQTATIVIALILGTLGVLMVGNVILFWLARRSGAVGGGKKKRPLGAKKRQRQVMARGLAAPE